MFEKVCSESDVKHPDVLTQCEVDVESTPYII